MLIIQHDFFRGLNSVTVCPITSFGSTEIRSRPSLSPTPDNGLRETSRVMVDKIQTVSRSRLGSRIGTAGAAELAAVEEALAFFLGLAG